MVFATANNHNRANFHLASGIYEEMTSLARPVIPDLPAELERLIAQIPRGRVATYSALAGALGDRAATLWVATYVRSLPDEVTLPVHRVVNVAGRPDSERRRDLLAAENVPWTSNSDDPCVEVASVLFDEFETTHPLKALQREQQRAAELFRAQSFSGLPQTIAGMDVAYPTAGIGVGSFVLLDFETCDVIREVSVEVETTFPYISGYLGFRELPLLLAVWDKVISDGPRPDIVMIDGSGLMHPRRAGIALHFGVLVDQPTIGIAKKKLLGKLQDTDSGGKNTLVVDGDEPVAAAVRSSARNRPVFVTPGHQMTLEDALRISLGVFRDHRLPEPTWRADRLSKTAFAEQTRQIETEAL